MGEPASTACDAQLTGWRTNGIILQPNWVRTVPIGDPLPNVAGHVERAVGAATVGASAYAVACEVGFVLTGAAAPVEVRLVLRRDAGQPRPAAG